MKDLEDKLKRQLEEFQEQHPRLSKDNIFVAWFLRAYLTTDEKQAVDAVTGGGRDKGIDAILVDDRAKSVFVIQAKYRQKLMAKPEARSNIIQFASLAETILDPDPTSFSAFLRRMEGGSAGKLREARQRILKQGYRFNLYYVTLGNCSKTLEQDARQVVRRARGANATLDIIDGRRVLLLLRDYLDGAAPPIPTLDLVLEAGAGVKVNGVLQRYDRQNNLESWVVSMRGDAIATLFEVGGVRLFARNIRGFLGQNTSVNRGMTKTLKLEPDHFFYYNNGITIVCDRAERISHKGVDLIRVSNPQVINGQQTTRMLVEEERSNNRASVLVKIIQVPRSPISNNDHFDKLISRIVQSTNWQNAIRPSDLMANDRRQIELENALRKHKYYYLRKRQSKDEARRLIGSRNYTLVTKEEIAQAVAGCDLDPVVARSGKDNLFTEDIYDQIFPNTDPAYYLPRYCLAREVTNGAKGYPQRGYTKWLVLGFLWQHLYSMVRASKNAFAFVKLSENKNHQILRGLSTAIDKTYIIALRYYNANKGRGDKAMDISLFFRSKKGRNKEFEQFWHKQSIVYRRKYDQLWKRVEAEIRTAT